MSSTPLPPQTIIPCGRPISRPHAAAPQVCLAVTHHDPHNLLIKQMERVSLRLAEIFGEIAVVATHASDRIGLEQWLGTGALVEQEKADQAVPVTQVGQTRRAALRAGLKTAADLIFYCDSDRILHWVEFYPDELAQVAVALPQHDLTVLGRTPRAFKSHPRTQSETEAIFNHIFALVSRRAWDIGAAARGLSRRAAQELLDHCADTRISTDASWPLHLLRRRDFSCAYLETEGLEFETADRFPTEVQAAGGKEAWIAQLDANPQEWAARLNLAQIEVEAILAYRPL